MQNLFPTLRVGVVLHLSTSMQQKSRPKGLLFCWLGWLGSNQRNARVKVWCLTTWLHPNITVIFYHNKVCVSTQLLEYYGYFHL